MATELKSHQLPLTPSNLHRSYLAWMIAGAACYAILLVLTINGASLWTDEAFSAYMASHKSLKLFFSTLAGGDSSDLQAAAYYLYLFAWTSLWGAGEFALRAANIPFIFLFAFVLVWTSWRVFRSKWIWIVSGLLPFLWSYASDVRAYFALVAFGTVCFGCLLAYFHDPGEKERRYLPWLVLASLFLGTTFHMLMLLAGAPMLVIVFFYGRGQKLSRVVADWKPAFLTFLVPFILLAAYLAWTFGRGTAYDYDKPGLLSMGSVIYRFLGLSGFGPNRRYDISFRPYLFGIALASLALLVAVAMISRIVLRTGGRLRFLALSFALVIALLQVVVLSIVFKQQVDVRHLAALAPLLLFLPLAASPPTNSGFSRPILASLAMVAVVWLVADCRLLLLPEYRSEDFRSAVTKAVELHHESKGAIALVADPAAAEYYGLDLSGPRPCFPLLDDCADAFKKVSWSPQVPAAFASFWTAPQIQMWLQEHASSRTPAIVVISRTRHPMYKGSPWWPVLSQQKSTLYQVHGFFVYLVH